MIHIALSIAIGVLTTWLLGAVAFGKILYGVIPGLIAMVAAFVLLGRRVSRDLKARMAEVQRILTPQNPMNPGKPRFEDAVKVLEAGMKWKPWHPFVANQLDGQIGMIWFWAKQFKDAQPYLERTSARNGMAKAMLGAIQYKRKNVPAMKAAFEEGVKYSPKESLLWNAYAWCLVQRGERDAAIDVLNRARDHVGGDARTDKNLNAIQNGKKPKMKDWGEMWYGLHLERPQQVSMMPQGKSSGKRQMYRGR